MSNNNLLVELERLQMALNADTPAAREAARDALAKFMQEKFLPNADVKQLEHAKALLKPGAIHEGWPPEADAMLKQLHEKGLTKDIDGKISDIKGALPKQTDIDAALKANDFGKLAEYYKQSAKDPDFRDNMVSRIGDKELAQMYKHVTEKGADYSNQSRSDIRGEIIKRFNGDPNKDITGLDFDAFKNRWSKLSEEERNAVRQAVQDERSNPDAVHKDKTGRLDLAIKMADTALKQEKKAMDIFREPLFGNKDKDPKGKDRDGLGDEFKKSGLEGGDPMTLEASLKAAGALAKAGVTAAAETDPNKVVADTRPKSTGRDLA